MSDDWRAVNRAHWRDRTRIHLAPGGYDLSPVRAGRGRLDPLVEAELGPVAGLRVLHLQSHLGDDSIALAQRGAREVVGVDFDPSAVAAASALARECGAPARFVESDVAQAPDALPGEGATFDLVFTTWGTINWHPDLARWAEVVAHFLRPGGALHFADAHPAALVFDGQAEEDGRPGWFVPYFHGGPIAYEDKTDYANPAATIAHSRTVVWLHTLGDILGALRAAGLRLDWLREHPRLTSPLFPGLVRDADGMWTWPDKPWLPLALSLRALKG